MIAKIYQKNLGFFRLPDYEKRPVSLIPLSGLTGVRGIRGIRGIKRSYTDNGYKGYKRYKKGHKKRPARDLVSPTGLWA